MCLVIRPNAEQRYIINMILIKPGSLSNKSESVVDRA